MSSPPVTGNADLDAYLYQIHLGGISGSGDGGGLTIDATSGKVYDPASGTIISYLYQYMHVKYADDNNGTNLSNTSTNKAYFGLFNSASSTESTNPADYTWYEVAGGFGTTKFFWYISTGGRQINYFVGTDGPTFIYVKDSGAAINLDVITGSDGSSARVCYAKTSSPTLSTTPASLTTIGNTSFPPVNSWGGGETWVATPPTLSVGEALYQSDGIYNPSTGLTTWNLPYLSNLRVGSLSAISANLGTITAGTVSAVNISASSFASGTISGTSITGGSLNINNKFIVDSSGNTTIQSGTTGARTVITDRAIKVFDAAGVLRVRIGDLTA